ncbi:hypothetical protein BDZ89DRAFT_1161688 [Hymenopellis radicata]|nr:hypothetical protein BDZ89DRAFT_1161688 [Hymenopellis radicata]
MQTPVLDSESAPYKWRTTLRRLQGNTAGRTQSASAYFKEETPPATLNSVLEERGRRIWAASSSAGDAAEVSIVRVSPPTRRHTSGSSPCTSRPPHPSRHLNHAPPMLLPQLLEDADVA